MDSLHVFGLDLYVALASMLYDFVQSSEDSLSIDISITLILYLCIQKEFS